MGDVSWAETTRYYSIKQPLVDRYASFDGWVAFMEAIGWMENTGKFGGMNADGYAGMYQQGDDVLKDLFIFDPAGIGPKFLGISTKKEFADNPIAQELVGIMQFSGIPDADNRQKFTSKFTAAKKQIVKKNGLTADEFQRLLGKTITIQYDDGAGGLMGSEDVTFSEAGISVAAHLVGQGALGETIIKIYRACFDAAGNQVSTVARVPAEGNGDGNSVAFSTYMRLAQNYDISALIGTVDGANYGDFNIFVKQLIEFHADRIKTYMLQNKRSITLSAAAPYTETAKAVLAGLGLPVEDVSSVTGKIILVADSNAKATDGADLIFGIGDAKQTIRGDGGTDTLCGGLGDDTLEGGTEDDVLVGEKGADLLKGGAGKDKYYAGDGDVISDDDLQGEIYVRINNKWVQLTGAEDKKAAGVYVARDGTQYTQLADRVLIRTVDGQNITVLGVPAVGGSGSGGGGSSGGSGGGGSGGGSGGGGSGGATGPGGFPGMGLPLGRQGNGPDGGDSPPPPPPPQGTPQPRDTCPVVLDMNGDGITTTAVTAGDAHFDYDGDGFAEATGWVDAQDGLLVFDVNRNGTIDDGKELLGNRFILADGTVASSGFEALTSFDTNLDGKVDALDVGYHQLGVWIDADSNGYAAADEIVTLAQAGIASIATTYLPDSALQENGNTLTGTGTYTRLDGTQRTMQDWTFQVDSRLSRDTASVKIPDDISALPNVGGYGRLHDLRVEMALDESGQLQELVEQFQSSTDRVERETLLTAIVRQWAHADGVPDDSRLGYYLTWKVKIVEAVLGETYTGPGTGLSEQSILDSVYNFVRERVFASLAAEGYLKPLVDAYRAEGVTAALAYIDSQLLSDRASGLLLLNDFGRVLMDAGQNAQSDRDLLRKAYLGDVEALAALESGGRNLYSAEQENIRIGYGHNFYSGSEHADEIEAIWRGDISAITGAGADHVRISDVNVNITGRDRLVDRFIVLGDGNDTLEAGESYTGQGAYRLLADGGNGDDVFTVVGGQGEIYAGAGDDSVQIAPAVRDEITSYRVELGAGSDTLEATGGSVVADGGDGDDLLSFYASADIAGGHGNDSISIGQQGQYTIRYSTGDGFDLVTTPGDVVPEDLHIDLVLGAGIALADLVWTIDQETASLALRVGEGRDGVGFSGVAVPNALPLAIHLSDGTVVSGADLDEIRYELVGTPDADALDASLSGAGLTIDAREGDDLVYGSAQNDTINGGTGNDTMVGNAGADRYMFGVGSGHDIVDAGAYDKVDRIKVGDLLPEEVQIGRIGNDLKLRVISSGDSIRMVDWFVGGSEVVAVEFDNGVIWDDTALQLAAYEGTDDADDIILTGQDDLASGLGGDDTLDGALGDDTLSGNLGSDLLSGGVGSDTYVYQLGDELDQISDLGDDADLTQIDIVRFGPGISLGDVTITRSSQDVDILLADGGRVQLTGQLGVDGNRIERIEFEGGSFLLAEDLESLLDYRLFDAGLLEGTAADERFTGSYLNDVIQGGEGADTLRGSAGDDFVQGGEGDDVYIYSFEDGKDIISDSEGSNTLILDGVLPSQAQMYRRGDDLVVRLNASDQVTVLGNYLSGTSQFGQVTFENGTTWGSTVLNAAAQTVIVWDGTTDTLSGTAFPDEIYGDAGDETLVGGVGDDSLYGAAGDDTYRISAGGGSDLIIEDSNTENFDRIAFGSGISASDIELQRDDESLYLVGSSVGVHVTVKNFFVDPYAQIEEVNFAGGAAWSLEDLLDVQNLPKYGSDDVDNLIGTAREDSLFGLGGSDHLEADYGDDLLAGGLGDDELYGGGGSDRYQYDLGDGNDTIFDEVEIGAVNVLEFGGGISATDVRLGRMDSDLIVQIGEADRIVVVGHFLTGDGVLGRIEFSSGESWVVQLSDGVPYLGTSGDDYLDSSVLSASDGVLLLAGAGRDTVYAGGGADTLQGGVGNDDLYGNDGSDTYLYATGDGSDYIYEIGGSADVLQFDSGISADQVALRRDETNLYVDYLPTGDTITIDSFFSGAGTEIESISFAGGPTWGAEVLAGVVYAGTPGADTLQASTAGDRVEGRAGNDQISGEVGNDVLVGGRGNDTLSGDSGQNEYHFARGDGEDEIWFQSNDPVLPRSDVVVFGYGIEPEEVAHTRTGNDLRLQYGPRDVVLLKNFFLEAPQVSVRFGNGSYWDAGFLANPQLFTGDSGTNHFYGTDLSEVFHALGGDDFVSGGGGADSIEGGEGTDHLQGGAGNDTIFGGEGDDYLDGWIGDDTYLLRLGGGEDYVRDYDSTPNNTDVIDVEPGLALADLRITRSDHDLFIELPDFTRITVTGYYLEPDYRVEALRFGDGSVVALAPLATGAPFRGGVEGVVLEAATGQTSLVGTDANDTLFADAGGTELDGGRGDDQLLGGIGNDVFIVDSAADVVLSGGGQDRIKSSVSYRLLSNVSILELTGSRAINATGGEGDELLIGNAGANVIAGNEGNDTLRGGGGDDTLLGGDGNDDLYGGGGSDVLVGGAGDDAYHFLPGDGVVVVRNAGTGGTIDQVVFGAGIAPSDVQVTRQGSDLVLELPASGDQLIVENWFAVSTARVDRFVFDGGVYWQQDHFETATSGKDTLFDLQQQDSLVGLGGNDYLDGLDGNDEIDGGAGNDTLIGASGNDNLRGGDGDDLLIGGGGDDTFYFGEGDGNDVVDQSGAAFSDSDAVVLDALPAAFAFDRRGDDLQIRILSSSGTLTISKYFDVGVAAVPSIVFSNGAEWTAVDVASVLDIPTSGDDTLYGSSLDGLGGNDSLVGLDGEASSLEGGAGDDVLLGADDDDSLAGGDGDDVLDGAGGQNTLVGGLGDDSYYVHSNLDSIIELAGQGNDHVYAEIDWTLSDQTESLSLSGTATSGIGNAYANLIEGNATASALFGLGGDDSLLGFGENDSLEGGAGADSLDGGGGDDTMIGGAGDDSFWVDSVDDVLVEASNEGYDSVFSSVDWTLGSNFEYLELNDDALVGVGNVGANLLVGGGADNFLYGLDGSDTLDGGAGADVMVGGYGDDYYVVDSVDDVVTEAAGGGYDGVYASISWTMADYVENVYLEGEGSLNVTGNALGNGMLGTTASNTLYGMGGEDILIGLSGDDILDGGDDNDILNAGDGADTLVGGDGDDELNGGSGNDLMIGGAGDDFYVVTSSADAIYEWVDAGYDSVDSYVDWTLGDNLESLFLYSGALAGTGNALGNGIMGNANANTLKGLGGADILIGLEGNDTIEGGTGNDLLNGMTGNDAYRFWRGDGADSLTDGSGSDDLLAFLDVASDQLWFRHVGNNLVVSVIGGSDKVTINGWYTSANNHVETLTASDGKILSHSNVDNLVNAMAAFSPPAAGETTLPPSYQDALGSVIASNWS